MTDTAVEAVAVETRSGDGFQIAEVDFPKRIVTCVAMPYERPAEITHARRPYIEVVSRGAFDGVEKRAGQIRANRDHSWNKVVGKLIGLHPSRKEGLVTEVKMFTTQDGEDTLRLCDEGGLDASAGFTLLRRDDGRVWHDAEVWDRGRNVRRLNRLWLDHLAFVPDPAYPDAAVIDIRKAQEHPAGRDLDTATPNLDRLANDELRALYEDMNRRYLR